MTTGFDIVLIFIGLELMAISTYLLVGAFSSGIFAYGLSLIYGLTGSTNLQIIGEQLTRIIVKEPHNPIAIVALLTTITGLLFKVAAVPFHQWAPDAYE